MEIVPGIARWIHFLAGFMWIGLLYYFNFVQAPALKDAQRDATPTASPNMLPLELSFTSGGLRL